MFKYKSPLSRLLEGSAKHANKDDSHEDDRDEAAEEPIADLNALRQVLAGGNQTAEAETEEPAEELVAEDVQIDEIRVEDIAPLEVEETPVVEEGILSEDDAADTIVSTILAEDLPGRTPDIELTETLEVAEVPQVDEPVDTAPEPVEAAAPAPAADRSERVKTTFLGFERPDAHVQDSMEAAPVSKQVVEQNSFPVGWLVVTQGPGRGTSFTLVAGLAQIGRNDDQAVQLDFGDNGISRAGHAVVAYNVEDRTCYLGHGGKANLVRLNGGPVLSTVPLSNGDMIRISDTTLRFVAFCDDVFDWQDS
ncbi:FHA domain-containing protein [Aliiroseovarius sp. PrR006]|uniref:FHA domain-containing protein n=1 Tax=Aliiroseovarius sp. PrR006 TaxID=2706883 RepID=UPI0013D700B6|nr:FHA domain-containing protein [Aliiroseovarius sp. PrR006]NDW54165.1 FHA domain-containing protein [Aliiroseovarius sp. PrR006]